MLTVWVTSRGVFCEDDDEAESPFDKSCPQPMVDKYAAQLAELQTAWDNLPQMGQAEPVAIYRARKEWEEQQQNLLHHMNGFLRSLK